ncbi:MAG: hypothetical protein ACJA01_000145 [Saprospiraceae bacterium]|jgi:hypothetical protein
MLLSIATSAHKENLVTPIAPPVANDEQQNGGEEFTKINAIILNSRLGMEDRKMEVEDVAKLLFLPANGNAQEPNMTVEQKNLENGNIESTIIHTNSPDNYRAAEKFVMILRFKDDIWQIVSLKKNWRCKKERTYQKWGVGACSQ